MSTNKVWQPFVPLLVCVLSASVVDSRVILPNRAVPPFVFTTLSGNNFTYSPTDVPLPGPILFSLFDPLSAFSTVLWSQDGSLLSLLTNSTEHSEYVFLSYAKDAKSTAQWMRERFISVMDANGFTIHQKESWMKRLHFVDRSVEALDVPFLWDTMKNWSGSEQQMVLNDSVGGAKAFERIDARFPWLYPNTPLSVFHNNTPVSIALYGKACNKQPPIQNVSGKLALVSRDGDCSYAERILAAQNHGATGVVVYSQRGVSIEDMNCNGAECNLDLHIPATMVPYNAGMAVISAMGRNLNTTVAFRQVRGPRRGFAIDRLGIIQEIGMLIYPSFQFFVWESEYLNYYFNLTEKVSALSKMSDFVALPVFNRTIFKSRGQLRQVNSFPLEITQDIERYTHAYIDFELNCSGSMDRDCPSWDHNSQLSVCCNADPFGCNQTSMSNSTMIGGTITPFRRRVGRWLMDVRLLLPLLSNSTSCTFAAGGFHSKYPPRYWMPSARLLLAKKATPNELPVPFAITKLWSNAYNWKGEANYNASLRPPDISVLPPQGAREAWLMATFKGGGTAEFLPTYHTFTIDATRNPPPPPVLVLNFTNAGTQIGCTFNTSKGGVPNEYGTWMYGRDGWCDGLNYIWHYRNVTDELLPNGPGGGSETHSIRYRQGYNRVPENLDHWAWMFVQSNLVFAK